MKSKVGQGRYGQVLIGLFIFFVFVGPYVLAFWRPVSDRILGGASTAIFGLVAFFVDLLGISFGWKDDFGAPPEPCFSSAPGDYLVQPVGPYPCRGLLYG
jgi:hypothetical protein